LRALLATVDDIEVVGVAADGAEALLVASGTSPEVVLMDLSMPGVGGVEATRELRRLIPDVRVVVLTSFADEELVLRAIDAGAVGYLLEDAEPRTSSRPSAPPPRAARRSAGRSSAALWARRHGLAGDGE
jgi:DNA-binding NarL/FixJ family response regulator